MPDWSINIVAAASGNGAEFVPDLHGAQQGDPLQAQQDDLVSWYNQTDDVHQPWQTDSNYNPNDQSSLSDPIPAGQSSDTYDCALPSGSPQAWTVYYYCNRHPDNPQERGSINVTALPTNSINIVGAGSGAGFLPPARGAKKNDLINWNNLTQEAHQPCATDAQYGSLSGVIQPGESSLVYAVAEPANNPTPGKWTIQYYCKLHPNEPTERGTIVVPPPN